jgi:ribosome maturation factor RimP
MANLFDEAIKKQARELLEPLVEQEGYELVDLVYRRERSGWVLRLYIDQPGGVTIDDCVKISGRAGDVLEVKDIIPSAYNLEVSSPGLDRPLRTEKDFLRAVNKRVKVQTREPIEGKSTLNGIVIACDSEAVALDCDGLHFRVPLHQVARAQYDITFS